MALTDILEKIKKETDDKISQLEKDFKHKKENLEKTNKEEQKDIDAKMHDKVELNSKKIIEKAENLADREAKNMLLKAKRNIIDEALIKAIESLSSSDKYEEMLTEMLKKADLIDDVVVIPAKGKEEATKKAIKESGKSYMLSDKGAAIKGGFILKTEKIEVDNSFETIIGEQLREDLEIKLHKLLF